MKVQKDRMGLSMRIIRPGPLVLVGGAGKRGLFLAGSDAINFL